MIDIECAAEEATPWLGFYVELLKRLGRVRQTAPADWYLGEAELLEQAAGDLLAIASELRAKAQSMAQERLPIAENAEQSTPHIDTIAFKRCFPDVPVSRADEVIAIYEYVTWLSPSLVLHPVVLRQEIDFYLQTREFSVARGLRLLRFEEQVRSQARAALDDSRLWNFDGALRARILTLGLVEAARRYSLS